MKKHCRTLAVVLFLALSTLVSGPVQALGPPLLLGPVNTTELQKRVRKIRKAFKSDNLSVQGTKWHQYYGYDSFIIAPDPIDIIKAIGVELQKKAVAKAKKTGKAIDWVHGIYLPYAQSIIANRGSEPSIGNYMYGNCTEMATVLFDDIYHTMPGMELAIVNTVNVDHCVLLMRSVDNPEDVYVIDAWWHHGVVIGPCKKKRKTVKNKKGKNVTLWVVDCGGKAGADPVYHGGIPFPQKWHRTSSKGGGAKTKSGGKGGH